MRLNTRKSLAAGACALALFGVTACGSDDTNSGSGGGDESAAPTDDGGMSTDSGDSGSGTSDAGDSGDSGSGDAGSGAADMSALVGPGCAAYAEQVPTGAGSVEGMAQDPVATAASNNPLLTTLVKAVSGKLNPEVNLVDDLNGSEITVLAPVDDAFAAIPKKDLNAVVKDPELLSTVLTYHVIPGRLDPESLVGSHKTLQGDKVKITGSPDALKIDGKTNVICGNVQTANATVYLIDGVLMP